MPHIVIEATPRLCVAIDFVALFSTVDSLLAAHGQAVLEDFKSRAHVTDRHLTGDGKDGESSWHASSLRIRDRRKRNVPRQW